MIDDLSTRAERLAERAETLPAFSGVKVLHIKRQIANILALIGRHGVFDEYTQHNISHIDKMLQMLDWLIPESPASNLSPADWLMLVLSIYFHDLGMLVTKKEYERRTSSCFREFCREELFVGDEGADYQAKLSLLNDDERERFLYQEFVRHNHADRVRAWIVGEAPDYLGVNVEAMQEVSALVGGLNSQFRRDLALVCASHHSDDLYDWTKYRTSQPYGDSDAETANVQYVAVLLRTADLLHITSDRTPSVMFRLIDPTDPISQMEWSKQMEVQRVKPKLGLDRDGIPSDEAPRDTIEVNASFESVDGFFGLTSYLSYAAHQLRKSYEWIDASSRQLASKYKFPWRYIDDSNVSAVGFLRNTFEFSLDQAKILDLLIGHTLYNDSDVVLRELLQNAFDAVRLQQLIDSQDGRAVTRGNVAIHWEPDTRELRVTDNGTGMTQKIIEEHLLRVGSSRYQDPQFRKEYPKFAPISRFGIGVLSAFMIADTVDIITCTPHEEEARQISLRSVHGKYLIRLLDKRSEKGVKAIAPHGTIVSLRVRQSAPIFDIIETARKWVIVPGFDVTATVGDEHPESVGYHSLTDALSDGLRRAGIITKGNEHRYRVVERTVNDVTLAYALEWQPRFHEWTFLTYSDLRSMGAPNGASVREWDELPNFQIGTCIQGIRVEFDTPGFDNLDIVALANIVGVSAPKTNVVRTRLEADSDYNRMLSAIYATYCEHVEGELKELYTKRAFSLSWAAKEAKFLMSSLYESELNRYGFRPTDAELLRRRVSSIPYMLIEDNGQRRAVSPADLSAVKAIWTIHGQIFQTADALMQELPTNTSLSDVIQAVAPGAVELPNEPIYCGPSTLLFVESRLRYTYDKDTRPNLAEFVSERDIDLVKVFLEQRRVDFRWVPNIGRKGTIRGDALQRELGERAVLLQWLVDNTQDYGHSRSSGAFVRGEQYWVATSSVEFDVQDTFAGVEAAGLTLLRPDTPVGVELAKCFDGINTELSDEDLALKFITFQLLARNLGSDKSVDVSVQTISRFVSDVTKHLHLQVSIDRQHLASIVGSIRDWSVFSPDAWTRSKQTDESLY